MDKDKIIKKLRTLKQFANLSEEELDSLAQRKIEEKELKNSFVGLMDEEVERALSLYYKYLDENSFESLAEKSTLINLVYKEILKERIQEFIKSESKDKQGAIPLGNVEKMMELDTQILQDKEKLGMLKDAEDNSFTHYLLELKQKAINYYNEHAGESYLKCPYCQNLFRVLMKLDNLETAKATFFKGTTLYNEKLMELYHNKKITDLEVAEILGVNINYVTFIYNNIYLKRE